MNNNGKEFTFPADTHDLVMIFRTTIESLIFILFFFFAPIIPWLRQFPQLNSLKVGVAASLTFSIVFLVIVFYQKRKNQPVAGIINLEVVGDAVLIIWLIFIFGGMNGPFFFFFFLSLMETAFTLNLRAIIAVAGMGTISLIGDYIYMVFRGNLDLGINSLIFIFFRLVTVVLISYYSYSFAKIIEQEKRAREEIKKLVDNLQEQKGKLDIAYTELQKLDKAKSEFISMASHQLRTPLSTIKGYVSMLLEGSYGKLTKKTREKLINVSISNDRLIGIVNDLLNISKIELGKMEVDKKIIQIEEIITSVYEEMLLRAEEKNLQLLWNKPVKPLPKTAVDEPKIRQVISNIVDNALKYTNEGKIEINAQAAGSMIRIRISDTGVGLNPEEINVIFSGFARGSAGINLFIEGSGLGLYVARRYIELHHGKIWANSKGKGLGSTFYIEIPITLNIDAEIDSQQK